MTGEIMNGWDQMSGADRRRWAIESVAMRTIGMDATLDDLIALSQKLVDFINGPQSAAVQSPSAGLPAAQHSSDEPDPRLRVTSEFREQLV